MTQLPQWSKWLANVCFVVGTLIMVSPQIAAESLAPWILYLIGNCVWFADVTIKRDKAWMALSAFFALWDVVIIAARIYQIELINYVRMMF